MFMCSFEANTKACAVTRTEEVRQTFTDMTKTLCVVFLKKAYTHLRVDILTERESKRGEQKDRQRQKYMKDKMKVEKG